MRSQTTLIAIAVAILTVAIWNHLSLRDLSAPPKLDEPVALEGVIHMGPDYVDCWQYMVGEFGKAWKCVYTTCTTGETEEECEARHNAKVARLQDQFPPCEEAGPMPR